MPDSNANPALEADPTGTPGRPSRTKTASTRLANSEVTPSVKKTGYKFGPGHGSAAGSSTKKRRGCYKKGNGVPTALLDPYNLPDLEKALRQTHRQVLVSSVWSLVCVPNQGL